MTDLLFPAPTTRHFHEDYSSKSYIAHALCKRTLRPLLGNFPIFTPTLLFLDLVDELADLAPLDKRLEHTVVKKGNWNGHWFTPKGCASDEVILYLHGGAYLACGIGTHRQIMEELALKNNKPVFAVAYRKFPEVHLQGMVDDCNEAVEHLLGEGYAPHKISVVGDSAGGGLSMRVAGEQLARGIRLKSVVLLSAWLDFDITQEEYKRYSKRDAYIPAKRLPKIAEMVVGCKPRPEDSPISWAAPGFPPVLFVVGSTEVLRIDAEQAYEHCVSMGIECELHIFSGGVHAFPVMANGFRESKEALKVINEFLADIPQLKQTVA